jgi:hypothetical protein
MCNILSANRGLQAGNIEILCCCGFLRPTYKGQFLEEILASPAGLRRLKWQARSCYSQGRFLEKLERAGNIIAGIVHISFMM